LQSFNSDGFTLGDFYGISETGEDFTSWTFRKAPSFFDVVTYTGNGVQNRAVPHGLGCTPGMVIIKSVSVSRDWHVWHNSFPEWTGGTTEGDVSGSNEVGKLELNNNTAFRSGYGGFTYANGTAFGLNRNNQDENVLNEEYVAYVFAHDDSEEGMIQCGSYTGTGAAGNEIDLGWEPQWVMVKSTTASDKWTMYDTMRGIITGRDGYRLWANEPSAESGYNNSIDVTPTGFKKMSALSNESGESYIYMAIRRPNRPAAEFEPDELFNTTAVTQDGKPSAVTNFPVDLGIMRNYGGAEVSYVNDRLRGHARLNTAATDAEVAGSAAFVLDYNNGYLETTWDTSSYSAWSWRRAPGFFDVVAYEGNGQAGREVPHSLGVAPEMMWIKARDESVDWPVYSKDLEVSEALYLSLAMARETETFWNNTRPTAEGFSLDANRRTNSASNTYIAYLFASVPGICDIGTYTGNGGNVDVDCGFTNGARFVLIKRTDAAGDWMVFDTLRGISESNSKMLCLNTTAAQVGGQGYIAPYSKGFRAALADTTTILDAEYIYMAIA
jgi:hypothetical protein